jgi:hypothetical protein
MVDLLDKVAYLLQAGSAWTAGTLFDLPGVPVLREGFVFHLAGVNIELQSSARVIRSASCPRTKN